MTLTFSLWRQMYPPVTRHRTPREEPIHAGHDPSRRRPRRQPDPVRPVQHRLRDRVQPGHADRRASTGWSPASASQGERLGEVVAGAVLKHSPRLQPDPRVGARLEARARDPAYDIQQACGTGLQAAIQVANKIALGQIEVGIAGGTDTTSDAPIAVSEKLRKILLEVNRAKTCRAGWPRSPRSARSTSCPSIPQNGEPRTGLSMGEHAALTALEWQIGREEQDELAVASHQHLAAAYDRGLPRRPGHAVPRPRARPEPARRLLGREARQAQAGLRQGRGGHDDRRQLDAAHRRRLGGAARVGGVGRGARPARCWPTSRPTRPRPSTTCTAARGC